MGFFWFWIVRAPFALAALLFLAGGALSVIDWSLALMGLAFFTLAADAAHHLGGHVRRREAAVLLAFEAVEEPKVMRGRLIDQHASDQSPAA